MWSEPRSRRPYEKKIASKGGALIFGMGLGALLATVGIMVGIILPNISTHLDNLSYRARSYYRKLIPHPEYLPTPAPTNTANAASGQGEDEHIWMNLPPVAVGTRLEEVIPAAIGVNSESDSEENQLSLPASVEETPPLKGSVQLKGFTHQWQTWNNCGPATITMHMGYFGRSETQADAALALKPNRDDKNVSPYELVTYIRSTGLEAVGRWGGAPEQIKRFLDNGLPVVAETWLIHDGDGLGHYRLITGYDDVKSQFNTFDSLNGPDYKVSYEQFDADWRVFNRPYIVIYPPQQAAAVKAVIGDDLDNTVMYEKLLAQAQADIEANPNDPIAYFNRGEALTRLERPQEAVAAFDRARQLGLHWRRLWYQFTPFEAYYAVGRYQDVLDLTEATLKGTGGLEEAYYYHGLALLATGQAGAEKDFQAALEYNPLFTPAAEALNLLLTNR
ncbi:MAG: C39 family peptidase [Anaerolineae bacterium]|nr:C39 family peptidase [Anaerolineae bacterium]